MMEQQIIPDGYKQTEVGVIPENWDIAMLGNIAQLERGKFSARPRNDPKYFGGSTPFIQTGDISRSNGYEVGYSQTINDLGVGVSRVFPENTLFFTIAANIGDMALVKFSTACPDSLIAIKPKSKVDQLWLFHFLRAKKLEFESLASHNAQLNINLEKLNPYLLPVPPVKEQTAIANALSDVDALIASIEKLIAKKQAIKTATMQQLLTGKKRLPPFDKYQKDDVAVMQEDKLIGQSKGIQQTELGEIPEDWEVSKLGDLGQFKNGVNKDGDSFGHGQPFVNLMDVFGKISISSKEHLGLIDSTILDRKEYDLNKGDVLFIRSSVKPSGVGLTALIETSLEDTVYSGFLIRYRANKSLSNEFKKYCFSASDFRKRIMAASSVSANTNINQDSLKQLQLIQPSNIDEQVAIGNVFTSMDIEINTIQQRLTKTQQVKKGMMQELLTGKTRLI
jgi:type I restriction enzyme S subunit